MAKDDRSGINPFTNKKHLDLIDDDRLLERSYNEYYRAINSSQLLDNTPQGELVGKIAADLINAVESFLARIGRSDYTEDYYDWEFHLVANDMVNAWCMPGGKIVMYSGIFGAARSADDIALILGHEMAHALLDHSRTQSSARNAKNAITTAGWIGSLGLSLLGMGELGALARTATSIADIGSEFLIMKPFGRNHEFEADRLGMMIMHWAGYDISGAPEFWERASANNKNEMDFFSTHPADSKRIEAMRQLIYEINNGKEFYNAPVLETGTASNYAGGSGISGSKSIACPNCGKSIDEGSNFCTFCGFDLASSKGRIICKNCGNVLSGDEKFCTNCGERV